MWATRVWWMLRSFGFRGELSVLDGGLEAWTAAGGEVAKEEVQVNEGSSGQAKDAAPSPTQCGSTGSSGSSGRLSVRPVRAGAFVGKARP